MVGSNPMTAPQTTTIRTQIVPVKFIFSDGSVFDASTQVGGMASSPLFTNQSYNVGTTQFGDAFMRGEFWTYAASEPNYHVLLASPVVEPTITINVPSSDGYTTIVNNVRWGYVTYSWFMGVIQPQVISQLGIQPSSLTFFATANSKVLEPGSNTATYSGFHYVYTLSGNTWTTVWASVTSTSVETVSHEVAEWLDDPFYNNHVPSWINPVSNACNGSTLEVGDPVTNYVFYVGGWEMQDEDYYSWFSHDSPSIGISGAYDMMGKLTTPATVCP